MGRWEARGLTFRTFLIILLCLCKSIFAEPTAQSGRNTLLWNAILMLYGVFLSFRLLGCWSHTLCWWYSSHLPWVISLQDHAPVTVQNWRSMGVCSVTPRIRSICKWLLAYANDFLYRTRSRNVNHTYCINKARFIIGLKS